MCKRKCDKVSGIVMVNVIHNVNGNIRLAFFLLFVNRL
jgi:hypothetical protein